MYKQSYITLICLVRCWITLYIQVNLIITIILLNSGKQYTTNSNSYTASNSLCTKSFQLPDKWVNKNMSHGRSSDFYQSVISMMSEWMDYNDLPVYSEFVEITLFWESLDSLYFFSSFRRSFWVFPPFIVVFCRNSVKSNLQNSSPGAVPIGISFSRVIILMYIVKHLPDMSMASVPWHQLFMMIRHKIVTANVKQPRENTKW